MGNFSRRSFLKSAGAARGAPFIHPLFKSGKKRPPGDAANIVFLFSDDHSVPDLGCYGNPTIHTPNLD
ncbi:MAG: hypothetical protein R3224_06755, partial [Balneolaceae bacterium]|nr:hypothetical protein [Balneolaceae bacterium]